MDAMNARQIIAWWERHGKLARVHVRPVGDGWANTLVCEDGKTLTASAEQSQAIARELDQREAN